MKVHSPRLARFVALAAFVVLVSLGSSAVPAFAAHEGTPTGVSLVPEQTAVTIPDTIKLTATADRHLAGTGYSIVVFDDDSGAQLGSTCSGVQSWCVRYGSTSWANNADPQPRHFHAELLGPGGGGGASSGQVTVEVRKHSWEVLSVVATPPSQVVPGSIQFRATLDHPVTNNGGGYKTYMYDEDNPLLPSSCPMNAWCVKTISRHWADNVSPKPARMRVEVRNASGDVASNTIETSAQFRRFLFTVNLSFAQIQMRAATRSTRRPPQPTAASTGPATGSRSRPATAPRSALRRAQANAAPAPSPSARPTAPSSKTAKGATSATAGHGPSLAPAARVILSMAWTSRCSHSWSPLTTSAPWRSCPEDRASTGTSAPDSYEACELLRGRGATALEILRDIVTVGGGLLVLHMLDAEQMSPQFDPESPPDDWETMIAPSFPAPQTFREDALGDRLQVLNQELSAPEANAVARQCLYLLGKRGLNGNA